MTSETQRTLLQNNEAYASKYTQSGLPLPPAKKLAIVTCMDARLDPSEAYGLSLGDAIVIRNAGASAREALRSLVLSEHLLGVQEVMIIKHTRCGLLGATNEIARKMVRTNLGDKEEPAGLDTYDFLPIRDLEESAKEDVSFLRGQSLLLDSISVSGWVYDVETGKVKKVVE